MPGQVWIIRPIVNTFTASCSTVSIRRSTSLPASNKPEPVKWWFHRSTASDWRGKRQGVLVAGIRCRERLDRFEIGLKLSAKELGNRLSLVVARGWLLDLQGMCLSHEIALHISEGASLSTTFASIASAAHAALIYQTGPLMIEGAARAFAQRFPYRRLICMHTTHETHDSIG